MKEAQVTVPHFFICPISLDLFKDPVTLCTGQTYDRSSIERWLSAGNLTCPVTMQKLHDLSMVPNHTLRHLINEWLHMGSQFEHHHFNSTNDSLASLKHNLQSHDVILEKKLQALQRIQSLSEESTSRNCFLLQLGMLPLLLELVFCKVESEMSQESIKFAEEALSCILNLLNLGENECLNILKEEPKMESFKLLLENGNIHIKEGLCHLIEVISSSLETRELCVMLCKNRRILQSLVLLVQETCGLAEAGIKAVSALCFLESNTNREHLVGEGAVNVLLSYISNAERRERNLAPKAMATIELLLELESAKKAVINCPNGVDAIVKMVFRVSDHQGSESAVRSLMIICSNSLKAREESINAGVLTQLLLLLQSQCSGRTKTKARMLLKLLRSKRDEEEKPL